VPCFRDLDRKPASCAPHRLNATNCVAYGSRDELLERVRAMSDEEYERLRAGALRWARDNSTRRRAAQLLESLGWPVPASPAAREPALVA
jgi:hypothetical protein